MGQHRDFYVYVLFRPWDGSPCYVGKGKRDRWKQHEWLGNRHPNSHLARIIAKAEGELPKVKIRERLTNQEALDIERAFITAIGRYPNGPLVNMTDGGDGKVGYAPSAETCLKIGLANTGKTASPETRAKMRASAPRTHSDSHNAAMRIAVTGKPKSEAAKANMRAAAAIRWAKEEERQKQRDFHANMTSAEKAARSELISQPLIRAKISAGMRAR